MIDGLIPALPPSNLMPMDNTKKKIPPTTFKDCITTNIIAQQATNNS